MKARKVAGIVDDVRRVFNALYGRSKAVRDASGLTAPQFWAAKLVEDAGAISIKQLARAMYLHPATVVGIVDRLEDRGIVVRERSSEDRRVVHVSLTPKGRKVLASLPEPPQRLLVRGLERQTVETLQDIQASLDRLLRILKARSQPARPIMSEENDG